MISSTTGTVSVRPCIEFSPYIRYFGVTIRIRSCKPSIRFGIACHTTISYSTGSIIRSTIIVTTSHGSITSVILFSPFKSVS